MRNEISTGCQTRFKGQYRFLTSLLLTVLVIALACSSSSAPIVEQTSMLESTSAAHRVLSTPTTKEIPVPTPELSATTIPASTPAPRRVPTPTPPPSATATPTPIPTPAATIAPTPTQIPTLTPTPTPTPTPTETPTVEQSLLSTLAPSPRAMMYADWDRPGSAGLDSLPLTVNLENDITMLGNSGSFLKGCTGIYIGDMGFYFGLQTNIQRVPHGLIGKGMIFSRWYDNDEPAPVRQADTRIPDDGWTESGDYEGNFVSVRGLYP